MIHLISIVDPARSTRVPLLARPAVLRALHGSQRLLLAATTLAVVALTGALAKADVTAEGDVSPPSDPALPLNGGTTASGIIVGGTGLAGTDPAAGRLVIDDPGFTTPLISPTGSIASTFDSLGEATISGFGSEWRINDLLTVGASGVGYMNITGGARVTSNNAGQVNNNIDMFVGQNYGSQGFVMLTGFASQLRTTNLNIGERGFGRIEAYDRSQITTADEAILGRQYLLTSNEIGAGYVILDGKGTRWNVGDVSKTNSNTTTGDLTVGREGRGTIEIRNQAILNVENDTKISSEITSFGQVYVNGVSNQVEPATLWSLERLFVGSATTAATGQLYLSWRGTARSDIETLISAHGLVQMDNGGVILSPTITSAGIIRGDGRLEGHVINNGQIRNAALTANLREKLWVTGILDNNSDIESIGGEMEFQSIVNNVGANADIVGKDAIFRFDGGINNTGNVFLDNTLVWSPGTFTSNAVLAVAANTSSLVGNLSLGASNSMLVELGQQFSRMEVSNSASLNGVLSISLADSYIPQEGDRFEIIEAASRTGTFTSVVAPSISGISFAVTYMPASVIVELNSGFDFNADWSGNGTVGPEDLAFWQANFGNMVAPGTLGDANGDGKVDGADFSIWQQQLGTMPVVAASGAAAGAVPEPGAFVMALAALVLPMFRRRSLGQDPPVNA